MPRRKSIDWVLLGGAIGEAAHCARCGEGLRLGFPVAVDVLIAAGKAFTKSHAHCTPGSWKEPEIVTPEDWAKSRDTGVSSATIWAVMTGLPALYDRFDTPKDAADFGRCHRLLQHFPEWRARLGEVAEAHPAWRPLVESWDERTARYEAGGG